MERLYGGIEAGGTKFVCAVGTGPDDIRLRTQFPTTTPDETIGKAIDFFRKSAKIQPLAGIGIASFGPVNLDRNSPDYGYITHTPKPGWSNTDFVETVNSALNIPVAFDTDVNGAALGEHLWGAAQGLNTFIYLTVGTGIGGGGMVNGELIHGLVHPEMGHVRIPHNRQSDPFEGCCPYHGDCLEGLACGKAMELRWGTPCEDLPADHPAWEMEAHYLALGLNNFICTLSPQRIIIGGGLMKHPSLLTIVRQNVIDLLNGYINSPQITENIEEYIISPSLGDLSGVLGAIGLAAKGYN
ncbi:ROK family protein [Chloroflexota bacterium]